MQTSIKRRKRDVILLSYFMGMSDAEIARKMKLVRSTDPVHPDAVTSGCDRGDSTTS